MYGQTRKLKEADVKALGGLGEDDRDLAGLHELVALGAVTSPAFKEALNGRGSVKAWFRAVKEESQRLKESNSETALGFLLRKGIQTVANDYYNVAPQVWRNYCEVVSSNAVAEWYAPLFPTTIADEVDRGGRFPDSAVTGENLHLVNKKFGRIVAFDRELFDDDQTGQIKGYSRHLTESIAVAESVYAAFRFLGTERTYANLTVTASQYATTDINGTAISTPWSETMYGSSLGNRPSTYGVLNIGRLKQAITTSILAVDPNQNKLIVNLNTLLSSAQDTVNGNMLLSPGGYPGVVGQSDTTAATNPVLGATTSAAGANQGVLAGYPGGWTTPNPFAGMGITHVVERYLPDWAWAVGEKKGFIFQERDGLEITQEGTNTGSHFNFDSIRFRSRKRFEVDHTAPRLWYLGNDGTVTGTL